MPSSCDHLISNNRFKKNLLDDKGTHLQLHETCFKLSSWTRCILMNSLFTALVLTVHVKHSLQSYKTIFNRFEWV